MKTILITGASSGIGKATALLFAAKGWQVVASMRKPEQHLFDGQNNIDVVELDVTDRTSIQNAVAQSIEKLGAIDVLVNSAGYGLFGVFEAMSPEVIQHQYEVNVFGLMNVTQAVLPHMRQNRSGLVVNLSSFGGIIALPFGTLYNSSKFAVEGFSEALSLEVSPFNIKVKLIEPGSIDTNFRNNMQMITGDIADYNPILDGFFPRFIKTTEHIAKHTAGDVAQTIYLASTEAGNTLRYVSGADAQYYIDLKLTNDGNAYMDQFRKNFLADPSSTIVQNS